MIHQLGAGAEAIVLAKKIKSNNLHLLVLRALDDEYEQGECAYYNFKTIANKTNLPRSKARRITRHLKRLGLAKFSTGLFDLDGMLAGSGYAITGLGRSVVGILGETP